MPTLKFLRKPRLNNLLASQAVRLLLGLVVLLVVVMLALSLMVLPGETFIHIAHSVTILLLLVIIVGLVVNTLANRRLRHMVLRIRDASGVRYAKTFEDIPECFYVRLDSALRFAYFFKKQDPAYLDPSDLYSINIQINKARMNYDFILSRNGGLLKKETRKIGQTYSFPLTSGSVSANVTILVRYD